MYTLLLFIAVVICIFLLVNGYAALTFTKKEEGFASDTVQIRFCPLSAPVIQTSKGFVYYL